MIMDKQEALIWKYLDRDCSDKEVSRIEQLLETDFEFQSKLEDAKIIHAHLNATALESVPRDLTAQVLQQITVIAKAKKYENINAKPLVIFLTFITLYLIINVVGTDLSNLQFNKVYNWNILNYLPQLSIPSFGEQGTYIAVSFLIVPVLYILDQLLQKRGFSKHRFLMVY